MAAKNHDDVWAAIHALVEENRQREAKTKKEMDELRRQLGGLGNGIGRLSEGIIAPNLPRLLRAVNIKVRGEALDVLHQVNGRWVEIDLVATGIWRGGGPVVVAVEVATHLTVPEVETALRKFGEFFDFFDEYRGYDLIGGVAGVTVLKEAAARARKEGLLAIAPSGETARLLNGPRFKPKVWRAGRNGR